MTIGRNESQFVINDVDIDRRKLRSCKVRRHCVDRSADETVQNIAVDGKDLLFADVRSRRKLLRIGTDQTKRALADAGVPIMGTSPETIDLAEDRGRFGALPWLSPLS